MDQIALWSRESFDEMEWEDTFFQVKDSGMYRVLSLFRSVLQHGNHIPVIWKTGKAIQQKLGLSSAGYWAPLKRAEERGFVFRIKRHEGPGSQKIMICKMPSESEIHALARAKGALERFEMKVILQAKSEPEMALDAIRIELKNRLVAE